MIKKLFNKWFKYRFLLRKEEDLFILEILEAYLTDIVLEGNEGRREELAEMQRKIEEHKKFIDFIKKI